MQNIHNFHAFVLVFSERVTSLTMDSLKKRIYENMRFTKHLLSQVSFLVYSDFRRSRLRMFLKISQSSQENNLLEPLFNPI